MLWILLACQAPQTGEEVEKEKPLPYIFEEEDLPEPSVDAAAVEAAALAGVERALQLRAQPVFTAYEAAMSASEAGCPDYYDYDGNMYWYDNCSTSGGGYWSGYSFYVRYQDLDDGSGNVYNGESLSGVSRIETPDGHVFEAGGAAYYYDLTHVAVDENDIDYTYFLSVVQGSFVYDGPETTGSWVEEDLSPDLVYTAAYVPSMDGHLASLDGSVGGLTGAIAYLVFDGLTLYDAALTTCPEEPGGGFSVRGSDGYWYDVTFDGATDWGETVRPNDCDGCGKLWFEGEELGQVCVDFRQLVDWKESPW
jgi:hypothetical protein